jgi:hypothetical protein
VSRSLRAWEIAGGLVGRDSIYGLDRSGERTFLVRELVLGETLCPSPAKEREIPKAQRISYTTLSALFRRLLEASLLVEAL